MNLLINEPPLKVLPSLAVKFCNDAIPQSDVMETVNLKDSKLSKQGNGILQNRGKEPVNLKGPITREYTETTQEITTENHRKRVYEVGVVYFGRIMNENYWFGSF